MRGREQTKRRTIGVLVGLACAAAAMTAGAPAAGATACPYADSSIEAQKIYEYSDIGTSVSDDNSTTVVNAIRCMVNEERASLDRAPLKLHEKLRWGALEIARDGTDGTMTFAGQQARWKGYRAGAPWWIYYEWGIVRAGKRTARQAYDAFMAIPEVRATLLSKKLKDIGVGASAVEHIYELPWQTTSKRYDAFSITLGVRG